MASSKIPNTSLDPTSKGSRSEDDEIADVLRQLRGQKEVTAEAIAEMDALAIEQVIQEKDNEDLCTMARLYFSGREHSGIAKDKQKALLLWQAAADKGDVNAQYSYALCLQSGEGVENGTPQPKKAVRILISLAERGHPWAQFAVATALLKKGSGVKVNESEALKLFKICAQNGVSPALYNIGNLYAEGKGADQDEDEALSWYEKAAAAGDPQANFTLGSWHCQGRVVEEDWDKVNTLIHNLQMLTF